LYGERRWAEWIAQCVGIAAIPWVQAEHTVITHHSRPARDHDRASHCPLNSGTHKRVVFVRHHSYITTTHACVGSTNLKGRRKICIVDTTINGFMTGNACRHPSNQLCRMKHENAGPPPAPDYRAHREASVVFGTQATVLGHACRATPFDRARSSIARTHKTR
jgi:hypothetical protein